jgi:hypothetical protein
MNHVSINVTPCVHDFFLNVALVKHRTGEMKRLRDKEEGVSGIYYKVNQDLSRAVKEFTMGQQKQQQSDGDDYANISEEDGDDDDEKAYAGEFGQIALGFKAGSSHAVIPDIRNRPLPREDGYKDNPYELQIINDRPYGKEYFNEIAEREKIMEESDDYRFVVLLAGAMGRSPIDIYEEQDMERLLRQRERDHVRIVAEERRRIVPVREKQQQRDQQVQKKKDVLHDQQLFSDDR